MQRHAHFAETMDMVAARLNLKPHLLRQTASEGHNGGPVGESGGDGGGGGGGGVGVAGLGADRDRNDHLVEMSVCADMEGHVGTDGRYYVLDCARLMPPEAPYLRPHEAEALPAREIDANRSLRSQQRWRRVPMPHLVHQLRPKVVTMSTQRLSSDGFSNFGRHLASTHNAEVCGRLKVRCTYHLSEFSVRASSAWYT